MTFLSHRTAAILWDFPAVLPLWPVFRGKPLPISLRAGAARPVGFGDVKYGPDFSHFDYANPDAPKGGCFTLAPFGWIWNQEHAYLQHTNTLTLKAMRRRAWN